MAKFDLTTVDEQFDEVRNELQRQIHKHGEHNDRLGADDPLRGAILGEEFGEVMTCLQDVVKNRGNFRETALLDLYDELLQVAAVAVQWANVVKAELS